jgi:hypothetical protein
MATELGMETKLGLLLVSSMTLTLFISIMSRTMLIAVDKSTTKYCNFLDAGYNKATSKVEMK